MIRFFVTIATAILLYFCYQETGPYTAFALVLVFISLWYIYALIDMILDSMKLSLSVLFKNEKERNDELLNKIIRRQK